MPTARLDEVRQVTLDANGDGTVALQVPWGETWQVTGLTVGTSSTATPFPTCLVYRGSASPANVIASTYSGQQDTAVGGETLFAGETLTAVWDGGVAGSMATLHVMGTVEGAGF
jgi:hypothetical protein